MNNRENLVEICDFLKAASEKSILSQIMLPLLRSPSNFGEAEPVALLVGNINARKSLKKDRVVVDLDAELEAILSEISSLKSLGSVIDLSAEMKILQIDASEAISEKEVEIKEDWTEADILFEKSRTQRYTMNIKAEVSRNAENNKSKLPDDIEEFLNLAEMEEQQQNSNTHQDKSKIKTFKSELIAGSKKGQELKQTLSGSTLKLPKINASNPLVGDIVEREPDYPIVTTQVKPDPVSSRIIANELRIRELKDSSIADISEKEAISQDPNVAEVSSKSLKKSSLFSRRKHE